MERWTAEALKWFGIAEHQVAQILHQFGQDSEVLAFGVVVLGLLLALAIVWSVFLGLLRGFFGLFGGGGGRDRTPQGPDLRDAGFVPVTARDAPGRLDVIPSAATALAEAEREQMALAGKPAKAVAAVEAAPGFAPSKRDARLAKAAGAAPRINPVTQSAGAVQRIKMKHLPAPAQRGPVVSARPEWTGKVVPSSLEDAGAVEVCRVLSRRATASGNAAPVRAIDYRVCGLPRVDGEGHRQPDVLVYTVADKGFLPKGAKRLK